MPSFFYVKPLSERARFGFSLTGSLGGGVDYGSDFVGRYSIRDVTLLGVGITPSFAYKVNDKLSLGAGVSLVYTLMKQSIAIRQGAANPALDGRIKFENLDDWGFQGILGLTYAFSDRLLLGLVYRSQADVDLEGDVKFEPLDEIWKLSAAYGWNHSDNMHFVLGATLYLAGSAPLEQSAQGVSVSGDYDTNILAIVGGTLRYDF